MRHILIALALVSPLFAAEPAPKDAAEAEMRFNKETNAAKEVYDAAVKAAQDKYVAFLKEEMKRLTTKGDLDGAVATRDKIKSLEPNDPKNDQTTVQEPKVPAAPVSWDDIKSPVLVVQANKPFEVGVLGPGKWEIIPNVNDKWATTKRAPQVSCTTGEQNARTYQGGLPCMLLISKFTTTSSEEVTSRYNTILVGPGKLTLQANDDNLTDNLGSIRVKIVKK